MLRGVAGRVHCLRIRSIRYMLVPDSLISCPNAYSVPRYVPLNEIIRSKANALREVNGGFKYKACAAWSHLNERYISSTGHAPERASGRAGGLQGPQGCGSCCVT